MAADYYWLSGGWKALVQGEDKCGLPTYSCIY